MEHEPCRLLGDADIPGQFIAGDTVFAVCQQPHGRQPLIETDGGILEDGSHFDAVLFATVPALEPLLGLQKMLAFGYRAAYGADRTVGPARRGDDFDADVLVCEVSDCIRRGFNLVQNDKDRIA